MKDIIINLLKENRIFYNTKGENVSKGCVAIQCPLCGSEDKLTHCNIILKTGRFFCWRNRSHRGPFGKLVKLLTGRNWVGSIPVPEDSEFLSRISRKTKEEVRKLSLKMPDNFRKIQREDATFKFWRYLEVTRGFGEDTGKLIKKYDLRGVISGSWSNRIVFPIYYYSKLMSWTARSLNDKFLPYRELEKENSVLPPKECLFDFDNLMLTGGSVLVITEGVFDCATVDMYSPEEVRATCLFTLRLKSRAQQAVLFRLAERFDSIAILLDRAALAESIRLEEDLISLRKPVFRLEVPVGFKDPDEMPRREIEKLFRKIIKKT